MPTQHDTARTRAFRNWLRALDADANRALDEAHRVTGIAVRSLQRMQRGTQPPPTRLLDQLAEDAARRGHDALAGELAGAATSREILHA